MPNDLTHFTHTDNQKCQKNKLLKHTPQSDWNSPELAAGTKTPLSL